MSSMVRHLNLMKAIFRNYWTFEPSFTLTFSITIDVLERRCDPVTRCATLLLSVCGVYPQFKAITTILTGLGKAQTNKTSVVLNFKNKTKITKTTKSPYL